MQKANLVMVKYSSLAKVTLMGLPRSSAKQTQMETGYRKAKWKHLGFDLPTDSANERHLPMDWYLQKQNYLDFDWLMEKEKRLDSVMRSH